MSNGTLYVLKSKSEDPDIKEHQGNLHKIGVTEQSVEDRIANAENDPTFFAR